MSEIFSLGNGRFQTEKGKESWITLYFQKKQAKSPKFTYYLHFVKIKWIIFSSFNKTKLKVLKLINEIDHMNGKLLTQEKEVHSLFS